MTVVPVSRWLGDIISESFLGKYPIHVIRNGIDIQAFYPRLDEMQFVKKKFGIENKFIILGVATGWSKDNGLYDFIELRKSLDENFAIVLVGVTESINKMLPNGIIGIERTDSQSELAALYTVADIFINGSFEETFGLVTIEAMACGTPVIVYDSTACPEVVKPGTGYVVPVRNIEEIKKSILHYKSLSDERKISISRECTEYVLNNFDKRNKYDEYVDLYDKILK